MATGGPGVSVLAPNGRRQTVKVTPRTTLLQVLEEVCKKQNFNPVEYDLKFQRTVLDLSLQWRFANLPNNAKLEMVGATQQRAGAESRKARVALQLADGARYQQEFLCSQTLWDVVSRFPETRVFLEASGLVPVCIYMRDEVTGEPSLRQTTLQSLGITGGSVIVRFVMRNVDQPVKAEDLAVPKDAICEKSTLSQEAESTIVMEADGEKPPVCEDEKGLSKKSRENGSKSEADIQERKDEVPVVESTGVSSGAEEQKRLESSGTSSVMSPASAGSSQSLPQAQASPFIPFQGGGHRLGGANLPAESSEAEVPLATAQGPFHSPGPSKPKKSKTDREEVGGSEPMDREPLVCHLDLEENLNVRVQEPTDDFFELTVDDVRRRFSELKSERQRLEESPLMTKAMRETQMREKLERYPKVVLRVMFPDRYIVQGFFRPAETVGSVKEFVRSHLDDPQLPFYLFITPPRTELKDDSQTLFQADLFPAAVVHFGSQVQREHFLRQELLKAPVPPSQADVLIDRTMPRPPASPPAPGLENAAGVGPTEIPTAPDSSAACDERPAPNAPQQVQREPAKVPKWLKLPGKK
ncbi:tether containing UBX domain for GLUT4 [Spea bombifrons]|uniref:tether containing UBX domain for GLUT4 n=1 Tax=Spea bombifrons TaxID=233779 RepID=UPI00234B9EB6|nr:tether containing UBX domain for GLUT4 [Spea bombifrons]